MVRAQPGVNAEFENFFDFQQQFIETSDGGKQDLIDAYITWQTDQGFPAVVNDTVAVFIYYNGGTEDNVELAGDMTGWSAEPINKLQGYNFHYAVFHTYHNARVDYKFVVNGNWILDPRNPTTVSGGFGPNSELAMPGFVQPPEIIERDGISKGTLEEITSAEMTWEGAKPKLQIYLPAGYSTENKYRTLYFADGQEYLSLAATKTVLDNLIADERIEPVIAVFADPYGLRHEWYNCSDPRYLNYLDVLVTFIDVRYSTNTSQSGRIHIGDSLGGQITAQVGLNRPAVFGLLGIHSGAFWDGYSGSLGGVVGCQIKDRISSADDTLDLKLFLTAGFYETTIWQDTKTVERTLREKQWQHKIAYLYEGHSWGQWRHTLDDMLDYLLNNNTKVTYTDIFPPQINEISINGEVYTNKLVLGTTSHENAMVKIELTGVTDDSAIGKSQIYHDDELLAEGTMTLDFVLPEGNHSLILIVEDIHANQGEMMLDIEVRDGFAPTFGNIILDPVIPVPDKVTSINVEVIDPHLTTVELYYAVNDEDYRNTRLTLEVQYWAGFLPKIQEGYTLSYYILATDTEGNTGKSEVQSIVVTGNQSSVDSNISVRWGIGLISMVPITLKRRKANV